MQVMKSAVSVGRIPAVLPLFLALAYALAMVAVPWESIAGRPFPDREVYLSTFEFGTPIIDELEIQDLRTFLLYEALWDIAVRSASDLTGIGPDGILTAVSFACFFIFSKYLFERHPPFLCAVLLLNPILVDFAISQLRMALAATLLLVAFHARSTIWRVSLALTAVFLHTASSIFIAIYFLSAWVARRVAERRLGKKEATAMLLLFGLAIVLAIGPARSLILGYLGDRRMDYEADSQSLLYVAFWMIFLMLQLMQPKEYFLDRANTYSVVIISVFVFSTLAGVYGSRFVAAAFSLVIGSMMAVRRRDKAAVLFLFSFYDLAQWYYWTAQT
jgi:hypothetical protein